MIRRATVEDVARIIDLGERNYRAVNDRCDRFNREAAANFVRGFVLTTGAVFLSERGMIGGVLSPRWHAPSIVEAVEMMWFSEGRCGVKLLLKWLDYAKQNNAVPVITSRRKSSKFLLSHGLEPSDVIYRGR